MLTQCDHIWSLQTTELARHPVRSCPCVLLHFSRRNSHCEQLLDWDNAELPSVEKHTAQYSQAVEVVQAAEV